MTGQQPTNHQPKPLIFPDFLFENIPRGAPGGVKPPGFF